MKSNIISLTIVVGVFLIYIIRKRIIENKLRLDPTNKKLIDKKKRMDLEGKSLKMGYGFILLLLSIIGIIVSIVLIKEDYENEVIAPSIALTSVAFASSIFFIIKWGVEHNTDMKSKKAEKNINCDKCNELVSVESMFCIHCGNTLKLKCTHCNNEISNDDSYCNSCGKETKYKLSNV